MRDLDPLVLLAVFQEMLGPLLWVLLVAAIVGLTAFVSLLVRERRVHARRLVLSQLSGLVGGVLALVLMATVSSSGYTDAGGPIDWIVVALVFAAGLVAATIVVYTIAGWWRAVSTGRHHRAQQAGTVPVRSPRTL